MHIGQWIKTNVTFITFIVTCIFEATQPALISLTTKTIVAILRCDVKGSYRTDDPTITPISLCVIVSSTELKQKQCELRERNAPQQHDAARHP